ncbi:MAG: YhdH/YhfP family quinone oxidoreductase [Ignavibacteria bacterium]
MSEKFKAFVVREENGSFIRQIEETSIETLPEGEVLINVKYSSLNYKDALSASGHKGVTRKYPHTPGIDAAGIVALTSDKEIFAGDEVLVTGYDLGMNTPGGFGEYIRVPAEWVVKLPQGLNLRDSMILGTAGFTAALSLYKLELNGLKKDGEVLITGATGAVGSISIMIFSKAGYKITASTGKQDKDGYLRKLGAAQVINRDELNDTTGKALLQKKWDAAVDTVGGNILTTVIKSLKNGGSAAACGLTLSNSITTTVYPFILRGVNLLGIASAETPMNLRLKLWEKLSHEWKPDKLSDICTEISLNQLSEKIDLMFEGKITGRILVNHTI